MSHADPPPIATWLLEHWTPGRLNDALAGDLLEEFRSGRKDRTGPWYWWQVLSVIAIGSMRELLSHRAVLLFATAWSMLTPSWLLIVTAIERRFNFNSRILQLEFPWSTLSDLGLLLAANLLFIWAGFSLTSSPTSGCAGPSGCVSLARAYLPASPCSSPYGLH